MQLFFVYDCLYCKTERDDPRDAIVFFFPPQVGESQKCTICCQLAGAVQFFQSTFSCPKVITLQKGKFALKKCCSRYLLALEANSAVPDIVVIKQLDNLYNVFCFYHKDIDRIWKASSKNRSGFLQRMEEIWKSCLALSCSFNNDILVAFNALPTVYIPEAVSVSINVQAFQLLQTCQRQYGIIAGCILFKNQILVTQFNNEISRYLTLVHLLPDNFFPEDVPTSFPLPPGVRIVKAFIQKNVLCHITYTADHYEKQVKSKLQTPKSSCSYLSDEIGSGSEGDVDTDSESTADDFTTGLKRETEQNKKRLLVRRKHHMGNQSSTGDCKNHEQKSTGVNISSVRHERYGVKYDQKESVLHSEISSDVWGGSIGTSINANYEMKDVYATTSKNVSGDCCNTDDTVQEMCLFIQCYLNCFVIFLMEPKCIQNSNLVQAVWNLGLPVLSELEVLLQCHMEKPTKGKSKDYTVLCFENQGQSLSGCPAPESFDKQHHQVTFKSMQHIHSDFESNPQLLDVSTVVCNTMIHACHSPVHEAFYHQEKPETESFSSHFTSLGDLPLKAVGRLEKQLGIFLP